MDIRKVLDRLENLPLAQYKAAGFDPTDDLKLLIEFAKEQLDGTVPSWIYEADMQQAYQEGGQS